MMFIFKIPSVSLCIKISNSNRVKDVIVTNDKESIFRSTTYLLPDHNLPHCEIDKSDHNGCYTKHFKLSIRKHGNLTMA